MGRAAPGVCMGPSLHALWLRSVRRMLYRPVRTSQRCCKKRTSPEHQRREGRGGTDAIKLQARVMRLRHNDLLIRMVDLLSQLGA